MGWDVFVMYDSANNSDNSTAPGARFGRIATAWAAASALGFFSDNSGTAVTVGNYNRETALLVSTATPTVMRYVTNIRYITDTGFAVSTPGDATEAYFLSGPNMYSTPKPSFVPRFIFHTTGSVDFTAASAWYGVDDGNGAVIGDSSNAGFSCAIANLGSSHAGGGTGGSWHRDRETGRKLSLSTNVSGREQDNYATTTAAGWWVAISLSPKSAGEKTLGAIALDITYS